MNLMHAECISLCVHFLMLTWEDSVLYFGTSLQSVDEQI